MIESYVFPMGEYRNFSSRSAPKKVRTLHNWLHQRHHLCRKSVFRKYPRNLSSPWNPCLGTDGVPSLTKKWPPSIALIFGQCPGRVPTIKIQKLQSIPRFLSMPTRGNMVSTPTNTQTPIQQKRNKTKQTTKSSKLMGFQQLQGTHWMLCIVWSRYPTPCLSFPPNHPLWKHVRFVALVFHATPFFQKTQKRNSLMRKEKTQNL